MKHVIVGTAGHIDHGKTSLIQALTGTNPDRLQEEQQRGITIDIGFASLPLPNGIELGIIDVPGHERFVKNMLAGVGGIDLAILVVAADEGVMPQTTEHLAICDLLQIQHGVVALTKSDLVDQEWRAMVMDELRATLAGTFLADAPMIPVSSKTGDGLDALILALQQCAERVSERPADGVFRLPIDRVFSIRGFGTVVTGTLISGRIQTENMVEVLPHQLVTRVRTIQVHDTTVPFASAGQRTALNLHGIERQALQRGDVLSEPGLLTPTLMLDAFFTLLPQVARPLKNRSRVRLHQGTHEVLARIVFFDRETLAPGEQTYVQFRLETPLVVMARDRYIVRSYSPVITIGGGEIVVAHPSKHKRSEAVIPRLRAQHAGTLAEILALYVEQARYEPISPRQIAGLLAVPERTITMTLQALVAQHLLINMAEPGLSVLHVTHYQALRALLLQALEEFHQKFPLKPGLVKEELRKKLPAEVSLVVFQHLLATLVAARQVVVEHELVRKYSHQVQLSATQDRLRQELEQVYRRHRFQPPTRKDALESIKKADREGEAVFRLLITEGKLVRVDEDLYYHAEVIAELVTRVQEFFAQHPTMQVGDLKTLCDVSRKYAVPLLTYLDTAGITIRKGDLRVLRKQA